MVIIITVISRFLLPLAVAPSVTASRKSSLQGKIHESVEVVNDNTELDRLKLGF